MVRGLSPTSSTVGEVLRNFTELNFAYRLDGHIDLGECTYMLLNTLKSR
jgi:hypothetical protein